MKGLVQTFDHFWSLWFGRADKWWAWFAAMGLYGGYLIYIGFFAPNGAQVSVAEFAGFAAFSALGVVIRIRGKKSKYA